MRPRRSGRASNPWRPAALTLPAGLSVGDPHLGPVRAQHLLGHRLGAPRRDLVQHGPVRDEHPVPVRDAVEAGRVRREIDPPVRFLILLTIRGDHLGVPERPGDRRARGLERVGHAAERVGDGALRDPQPEQLAHEPAQPLEADMMTVVETEQQRVEVRRERRARRHARGRLGPEPASATGTAPAQKLDPRGVRHDRRDVDMVVSRRTCWTCPETSAPQWPQASARRRSVSSGSSARRRDVPGREGRGVFAVPLPGRLALGPEDGGRCEFFEVFLGADSLASSSAIRAACAAINAA